MKDYIINTIAGATLIVLSTGCVNTAQEPANRSSAEGIARQQADDQKVAAGQAEVVHLSAKAFEGLDMHVDTLPTRMLYGRIAANGRLEVPPQHKATVTAVVGANVTSVRVIEGDKVSKGTVLAYVAHPDLIQLQTDYIKAVSQLQFMEKEMQRQSRLYEAEVSAGKAYQKIKTDYRIQKASVEGLAAQLAQLHLNVDAIREGNLYREVPVVSPIAGYIEKLEVEVGQYVPPQKGMFQVINSEHVHADLMVFEKDVHRVAKGQTVFLTTASTEGLPLKAKIFAVGKTFEQDPRAVHIHAEIENKQVHRLIPGMYVQGTIQISGEKVTALPDEAIATEKGNRYIFTARPQEENGEKNWAFTKVEVRTGKTADGWTAIQPLHPLAKGTKVAWNNAYDLMAEMNKSEAEHHH